jgi:3-isopropylmalate/(R)-2-methylmalate dehydratase small subunit
LLTPGNSGGIRKLAEIFTGTVWKFGDDINTDLMVPSQAMKMPPAEMPKYCFSTNRPGWVNVAKAGDIIVAGNNFGCGSSRPGAKVLKDIGISCVLAETINGLFLRSCVNVGLPVLPVKGVYEVFQEGEIAEIYFRQGRIINKTKKLEVMTSPLPEMLLKIIEAGGVIPMLDAAGCLE